MLNSLEKFYIQDREISLSVRLHINYIGTAVAVGSFYTMLLPLSEESS